VKTVLLLLLFPALSLSQDGGLACEATGAEDDGVGLLQLKTGVVFSTEVMVSENTGEHILEQHEAIAETYRFLSASQKEAVKKQLATAIATAQNASERFSNSDAAIQKDVAKHLMIWFGLNSTEVKKHVKDYLEREKGVLGGGLEFYVPEKADGVYACGEGSQGYVVSTAPACSNNATGLDNLKSALGCSAFEGKRLIYLCPPFFSGNGQAVNTLLHEGYHQVNTKIIDTEIKQFPGSYYYGAFECQELALAQKGKTLGKNEALLNAASWERFTMCVVRTVPSADPNSIGELDPCSNQLEGMVSG